MSDLIRHAKIVEEKIQQSAECVYAGVSDSEEEDDTEVSDSDSDTEPEDDDESGDGSDSRGEVQVLGSDSSRDAAQTKKASNKFRSVGEALGDDLPKRSRTTPVSVYERKQNQASLDQAIVSLVEMMKEDFTSRRESTANVESSTAVSKLEEKMEKLVNFYTTYILRYTLSLMYTHIF